MGSALFPTDFSLINDGCAKLPTPARLIRFGSGLMTIHADSRDTHGGFALVEISGEPGGEPPLHVHSREDELFYVLEGELTVQRGDETLVLGPGESGFLPRQVPHTFRLTSDYARWLVYITPGGFEEYFRTFGEAVNGVKSEPKAQPTADAMAAVGARHGIRFLV